MSLHFLVLSTLRNQGGRMNFTDPLNHLPIHEEGGRIYSVLRELNQFGWITGDLCSGSTVRLTPAGTKFLFEQDLKQDKPGCNVEPEQNKNAKLAKPNKIFDFFKRVGFELVVSLLILLIEVLFGLS